MTVSRDDVVGHFTARASRYDRSSAWCTDDALAEMIVRLARPGPGDRVLDVACGTGLVSRAFKGRVGRVVGLDITADMAEQARSHLDELVIAPAEKMPFNSGSFDIVFSRQGVQFMDLPDAIAEMARVTRPGGRIVIVNLCAYGPEDREEYFEILRLRNPVRRHFFLPDDLGRLLTDVGCDPVTEERYVSVEDVDVGSTTARSRSRAARRSARCIARRRRSSSGCTRSARSTAGSSTTCCSSARWGFACERGGSGRRGRLGGRGWRDGGAPAPLDRPWPDDDRHANFKAEVQLYGKLDPLVTIRGCPATSASRWGRSRGTFWRAGRPAAAAGCWSWAR